MNTHHSPTHDSVSVHHRPSLEAPMNHHPRTSNALLVKALVATIAAACVLTGLLTATSLTATATADPATDTTAPAVGNRNGPNLALDLPTINAKGPITPVGTSNGEMNVPANQRLLGWLRTTGLPGDKVGNMVIAGHVASNNGSPGTLNRLKTIKRGAKLHLTLNGTRHTFKVTGKTTYRRGKALPANIFATTGPFRLRIVTCTNKQTYANGTYHYRDNLVVTAIPVR